MECSHFHIASSMRNTLINIAFFMGEALCKIENQKYSIQFALFKKKYANY